jgi:hypothetical protein
VRPGSARLNLLTMTPVFAITHPLGAGAR